MTGGIPAELGQLENLTHLSLSRNELTGGIPAELGQLENLTRLSLSRNELTGAIPVELAQLKNLAQLRLHRNELTGAIPAELAQLKNLELLWLDGNELTGAIPAELAQLKYLTRLTLGGNQLTGCIPSGLEYMRDALDDLGLSFLSLNIAGTAALVLSGARPCHSPYEREIYHEDCYRILAWVGRFRPNWLGSASGGSGGQLIRAAKPCEWSRQWRRAAGPISTLRASHGSSRVANWLSSRLAGM